MNGVGFVLGYLEARGMGRRASCTSSPINQLYLTKHMDEPHLGLKGKKASSSQQQNDYYYNKCSLPVSPLSLTIIVPLPS